MNTQTKRRAAKTDGDSFAEIFAREGILPVAGGGGFPAPQKGAAVSALPPDDGEDSPFAEKKFSIAGGADSRRLMAMRKKPPEDSLDLHGLTAKEAHAALDGFLRAQIAAGRRHVEIIHGKSGRGADGKSVLRAKTRKWLAQSAAVLGYAEAVHNAGAVRVMLRRGGR